MKLRVLASSSAGNCYLLETDNETLIIECGIKITDIKIGLNFDLSKIVAMLLSHEHNDHSRSVKELMSSGIEVYMSEPTAGSLKLSGHRLNTVEPLKQFEVGSFRVLPFEVQHDSALPLGYLIEEKTTGYRLLFATDTYYLRYKFPRLNGIMIECNYIKETLDQNIADGYIDGRMKPRLLQSHFSLENVKEFLKANDLSQCKEIILLHLSDRNSDANQMIKEIEEVTGITPKIADKGLSVNLQLYPY